MASDNSKELSGTLCRPNPSPIIQNIPFLWLLTPEMCVVNISIAVCNLLYLERVSTATHSYSIISYLYWRAIKRVLKEPDKNTGWRLESAAVPYIIDHNFLLTILQSTQEACSAAFAVYLTSGNVLTYYGWLWPLQMHIKTPWMSEHDED